MRIFRPLFFGLACGGAFGFPETGRFLLFGRDFLPWGRGGAFFGLGGGGAFFALGAVSYTHLTLPTILLV